MKCVRLEDKKV